LVHLLNHCMARSRQLIEHEGEEISIPSLIEPLLSPVSVSLDESQSMRESEVGVSKVAIGMFKIGKFFNIGKA
jgi:hypothetical protein